MSDGGTEAEREARAVAADAARGYESVFGMRLLAVYALGSLAHGGYAPAVSDIDLAVVLADRRDTDRSTVDTTTQQLQQRSPLHRKLSVFWASVTALQDGRDDGRFPAYDRSDLARQGLLLAGTEVRPRVHPPAPGDLLVDGARFALTVLAADEVLAEFRQPRRLLSDPLYFTKAVLFAVRFSYSLSRPDLAVATNDAAIDWYLRQPEPVAADLVRFAAEVRHGAPFDPSRARTLLAGGLTALYLSFVDRELVRLGELDAPGELAGGFRDWRQRLASVRS